MSEPTRERDIDQEEKKPIILHQSPGYRKPHERYDAAMYGDNDITGMTREEAVVAGRYTAEKSRRPRQAGNEDQGGEQPEEPRGPEGQEPQGDRPVPRRSRKTAARSSEQTQLDPAPATEVDPAELPETPSSVSGTGNDE